MNLADLVAGRDIRLAPVREREGAVIEYRVILVGMLRAIDREARQSVLAAYREARASDGALVVDSEAWFFSLRNVARDAVARAIDAMEVLFGRESISHARRFIRSIARATGIDVPEPLVTPFVTHERVMRDIVARNSALIGSLSQDAVGRIEDAVYRARTSGVARARSIKALSRDIRGQLDIAKSRADLIAEDQIASLNASLTEMRHLEAGADRYAWSHQQDDLVRSRHRALQGRIYRYGESTGAEGGAMPGMPVRCRCVAVAVFPDQKVNPVTGAAL